VRVVVTVDGSGTAAGAVLRERRTRLRSAPGRNVPASTGTSRTGGAARSVPTGLASGAVVISLTRLDRIAIPPANAATAITTTNPMRTATPR
jgi:FAD/FMN-containing dehydrogenase